MIDQLYDRDYQAVRARMNADLGRSLRAIANSVSDAFKALNRIEYAAPWSVRRTKRHCR